MRILFVCKENKNYDFNYFCQSFCCLSVFDARSQEYHDRCVCIPLLVNKAQHIRVLRQNAGSCVSSIICMRRVTFVNVRWREEIKLHLILKIFFKSSIRFLRSSDRAFLSVPHSRLKAKGDRAFFLLLPPLYGISWLWTSTLNLLLPFLNRGWKCISTL